VSNEPTMHEPSREAFVDGLLTGLALGGGLVDRAAHRRLDESWLDKQWTSGTARVIRLGHDATLLDTGESDPSHLFQVADPASQRPELFVGVHESVAIFVEVVVLEHEPTPAQRFATLRTLGLGLAPVEQDVIAQATGLVNWHRRHAFCPRCGGATRSVQAGYARVCVVCEAIHYPRSDPAVIVMVTDDQDRALLGRQASWPAGRFSTLAGFVEPGESAETAVRREVFEEAGIRVGQVTYAGSQPWPFPGSLMIGFLATATTTDIVVDGVEIGEARWFSRDDMAAGIASGELAVAPGISISRRLIEHWFGDSLAGESFLR